MPLYVTTMFVLQFVLTHAHGAALLLIVLQSNRACLATTGSFFPAHKNSIIFYQTAADPI